MEQINPFLKKLLDKVELSNERVLELLNQVCNNTDDVLRLMAYLSCAEELPEISKIFSTNTRYLLFKGYNILNNNVSYEGWNLETRWYKTEKEAAASLSDNTHYDYSEAPGRWNKSNEYPFEGKAWCKNNGEMSLDKWNK